MATGLVEGFEADEVGRDVAAHVEALHFAGGGRGAPLAYLREAVGGGWERG